MVWSTFSWHGVSFCVILHMPSSFVFKNDNEPKHISRLVKNYLLKLLPNLRLGLVNNLAWQCSHVIKMKGYPTKYVHIKYEK